MLKSLLSLLLSLFYSKSESAEVASQSLPNETDFTSVTLNTSQPDTFAAPYDGYLCIVVDTGGSINVWGDGLQSSNYSLNNGQSKLFVPMRKGNIIGYSISGRLIFGKFYKLVGGGYNTIEKLIRRGGGLCLKHSYSSLRRSFLSVRRHGSATSLRPSYQGARKSPLSLAPILKTTQRHATELYVSILSLSGQSSALLLISGVSYFTARTKQEFIKCSRFLSQRVKRSTLASQRIKAPLISSSFRLLAPQVNFAVGGASC